MQFVRLCPVYTYPHPTREQCTARTNAARARTHAQAKLLQQLLHDDGGGRAGRDVVADALTGLVS